MQSWFKPEVIVPVLLSAVVTLGGTFLLNWSAGNVHTAVSDVTMNQLDKRLASIEAAVSNVPLYALRLTQLEAWKEQQLSYNGAVDGKIGQLSADAKVMQSQLDDVRRASGTKLR